MRRLVPELKGSLENVSISNILGAIKEYEFSCVVFLSYSEYYKVLYFKKGRIFVAYSNLQQEQLPYLLDQKKLLSEKELNDFINIFERSNHDLLSVLRSYKSNTFENYQKFVSFYFNSVVLQLFSWKTGNYRIDNDEDSSYPQIYKFPSNFNADYLNMASRVFVNQKDKTNIEKKINDNLETVYIINKDCKFSLNSIPFIFGTEVLALFEDNIKLKDVIIHYSNINRNEINVLIFIFIEFGFIIELSDIGKSTLKSEITEVIEIQKRISKMDFFEILGVSQDCPLKDIKNRYYQLARKFHPDNFKKNYEVLFKPLMESYFGRITEAYSKLKSEALIETYRIELDATKGGSLDEFYNKIMLSEEKFKEGLKAIYKSEFKTGLSFIREAINIYSEEPEYHFYEIWAGFLASEKKELAVGQDCVKKLLALGKKHPNNYKVYFFIGKIYKFFGDFANSKKYFELAGTMNSTDRELKEELTFLKFKIKSLKK